MWKRPFSIAIVAAPITVCLALAGCGGGGDSNQGLPQGSEPVTLDPADFTLQIDNPYWPMSPGSEWV